ASGVTRDFHVGKWFGLRDTKLAEFGQLQQSEERRENLPRFGAALDDVRPVNARLELEHGANDLHRARNVDRARNDLVHVRRRHRAQHAIDRGEQFRERECQWRHRRRRGLRQIRARKLVAPLYAAPLEEIDHLAHLLILEQPPHQLGAWIFPRLDVRARQQHLRLDAQQPSRHLEILRGFVQPELANAQHELLAHARDRDVVDVHLLLANEREQQVERSREARDVDQEGGFRSVRIWSVGSRHGKAKASVRWLTEPVLGRLGQYEARDEMEQALCRELDGFEPPVEKIELHHQDQQDDAGESYALVLRRPGRRQQILDDVRPVERRHRNEIERDEAEVKVNGPEHHRLRDGRDRYEPFGGVRGESDQRREDRARERDDEIRRDAGE